MGSLLSKPETGSSWKHIFKLQNNYFPCHSVSYSRPLKDGTWNLRLLYEQKKQIVEKQRGSEPPSRILFTVT